MIIQASRLKHARELETAAELSFLQAQIKPHFLFNTLNTFVSISRYDMDKARELLLSFSNYLRRSFDFKDLSQLVPLKDEIEMARSYAEIETARFEERLEIRFDVPDDLEIKVPILMLQPVLENAVNHGILPKPEGGRIDITIRREGKLLKFSVKDNGVGTDAVLKKGSVKTEFGSGVGLSNIDSRLRKLFRQRLHVVSSPGNGTEVVWYVPVGKNEAAKIAGNAAN
jgi:sensor histidine kinase YesM